MEHGESPRTACEREILEETGLEHQLQTLLREQVGIAEGLVEGLMARRMVPW